MTSPMPREELQTCRDLLAMLQDENGEVAEYWGKMLAHIDAQAAQIDALKEKLVEERAKTIATQELRESPEQAEEIGMRVTAGFSELPAWMTDHYRDVARQQLAEELKAAGVTFGDR